ncbi:MAG TPA: signal peptidase I [Spirochaetia bacterium]|nr:signal peptidase I [Spirochaetales bacterium]HRS64273.1 signal peptidase I [Spirochaetia bacterium]HPD80094.1 signal peptidase I [Spirochaetales bacterium]HQG39310.1 signal peptidase I [Spirochaetales bacterium]HQK33470.1 signal peptidase I [Spirochaetales bacterium]
MKHFESYSVKLQRRKKIFSFLQYILIVFLSFELFINDFARPYKITNDSMSPNLLENYHVITSPLVYGIKAPFSNKKLITFALPKRGDIVTISQSSKTPSVFLQCLNAIVRFFTLQQCQIFDAYTDNTGVLVRRIVGIPGDTIYMDKYLIYNKNQKSYHFLSEFEVSSETYDLVTQSHELWPDSLPFSSKFEAITLGENQYFVLSDNRTRINDSRYWGVISLDNIIAKVILVYWPFQKFQKL